MDANRGPRNLTQADPIGAKAKPRPLHGPKRARTVKEGGGRRAKGRLEHIEGHGSTQGGYQTEPYKRVAIGIVSTSHQH